MRSRTRGPSRASPRSSASSETASESRANPAPRGAEALAGRDGDALLDEQALGGNAVGQLDPDVERSFRRRRFGNASRRPNAVAPRLVERAPLGHRLLRTCQRGDRGLLHRPEDPGAQVVGEQVRPRDDLGVADDEPEPPAGHPVALRHREELDADLLRARGREEARRRARRRRRGRRRRSRGRSPRLSARRSAPPRRRARAARRPHTDSTGSSDTRRRRRCAAQRRSPATSRLRGRAAAAAPARRRAPRRSGSRDSRGRAAASSRRARRARAPARRAPVFVPGMTATSRSGSSSTPYSVAYRPASASFSSGSTAERRVPVHPRRRLRCGGCEPLGDVSGRRNVGIAATEVDERLPVRLRRLRDARQQARRSTAPAAARAGSGAVAQADGSQKATGHSSARRAREQTRLAAMDGFAELHTHLGGSVDSATMWTSRARAGDRAAGQGLLGVRPPDHRLRPARRRRPRRARRDLPLDRADPVESARGRALCARRDRRRLPLAGDHDARAPLQPDEAQPRRRARPRPHHPRRDPRARPGAARVPAGARWADPDDGPDVHGRAEHDRRREGDRLGAARHRRHRHRRPTAGRRRATTTASSSRTSRGRAPPASASRSTSARRAAGTGSTSSREVSSTCAPTGSATASSPRASRSCCGCCARPRSCSRSAPPRTC